MKPTMTQLVLRSLNEGKPFLPTPDVVRHGARNKMLLHILRRMNIEGPLRDKEERAYSNIIQAVGTLARELDGLNYAFFKLIKPVEYVPDDIDLLTTKGDIDSTLRRLLKTGLKVVVKEPYCVTLNGPPIVDVYLHPSLANVIYLDGEKLMEQVVGMRLDDVEAKVLTPETEALVATAHSLYKEHIFTLNDYFTIKAWTNEKTYNLAEKMRALHTLKLAKTMICAVEGGLLETPYKVPLSRVAPLFARKIIEDRLCRVTLLKAFKKLSDKRLAEHIKSRVKRESY